MAPVCSSSQCHPKGLETGMSTPLCYSATLSSHCASCFEPFCPVPWHSAHGEWPQYFLALSLSTFTIPEYYTIQSSHHGSRQAFSPILHSTRIATSSASCTRCSPSSPTKRPRCPMSLLPSPIR